MHQLQTILTADIKIEHVNRIDHEQETAVKNMSKNCVSFCKCYLYPLEWISGNWLLQTAIQHIRWLEITYCHVKGFSVETIIFILAQPSPPPPNHPIHIPFFLILMIKTKCFCSKPPSGIAHIFRVFASVYNKTVDNVIAQPINLQHANGTLVQYN